MKLKASLLLAGVLGAAITTITTTAHAAAALPALNVDTTNITVSGLSSGAAMAVQLAYAYSATFKGVGVFAGSPYRCQGHNAYTACQNNSTISPAMLATMQADINSWSGTLIDNKSNVASQNVYLFVGANDSVVGPNPMVGVQSQYVSNGVASVSLIQRAGTAHVFPTDFSATGNNPCNLTLSPYISNCGYDGAKAVLTQFYGTLNPRNNAPATANYIEFSQSEFTGNLGMAATGWVYVPSSCAAGTKCKLHVAFHGCAQNYTAIGNKFVRNTGYTRWADTNNMIVLFPQTRNDLNPYPTPANGTITNTAGCWDIFGLYGTHYAQKAGSQLSAIKAMVDRLSAASH
jgi:poly(3-hydroxybutyrate) depolymerase